MDNLKILLIVFFYAGLCERAQCKFIGRLPVAACLCNDKGMIFRVTRKTGLANEWERKGISCGKGNKYIPERDEMNAHGRFPVLYAFGILLLFLIFVLK